MYSEACNPLRNSYCVTFEFITFEHFFLLIFMYVIRFAILAFILCANSVFIHRSLCTKAAVMLHHELVLDTSIIFFPPPQTLTFQVKVPWNILLSLLIQHLLRLLAIPDLEGSMYHAHCVTSYILDWAWQVIFSIFLSFSANF